MTEGRGPRAEGRGPSVWSIIDSVIGHRSSDRMSEGTGDDMAASPQATSEIPRPRAVEEAGDDAVLADLQDGSELAGDERRGGPGAFGGDRGGEAGGVVAEDGAEGEEPAGAVGCQGAVESGEGLEDGRCE